MFVADMAGKLIKLIIASLGLDVETFYKSDFENCKSYMRIVHYPSEAKSADKVRLLSHADMGCMTILYQDNCGGLQILSKEGNWYNVKPQSDSLIINLGDSLKVRDPTWTAINV